VRASEPGLSQDFRRELKPGAVPLVGYVIRAQSAPLEDLPDLFGRVHSVGGRANLIVNDAQILTLPRAPEDGANEVLSEGPEQPRYPHNPGVLEHPDVVFPFELAPAIRVDRVRAIGLNVGRVFLAVEHVVGTDVEHTSADLAAGQRDVTCSLPVHLRSKLGLLFAIVNRSEGCGMNDDVRAPAGDGPGDGAGIGDVCVASAERQHFMARREVRCQVLAEHSFAAGDQDPQSV
jgi:hypothetical protein